DERSQDQRAKLPADSPGQIALALAADDDGRPGRGECPSEPGERRVAGDVDDHVVAVLTVGEVLLGTVDDPVRTETADQVELFGAAHPGDVRAGGLGQLHREAADTS